MLIDRIKSYFSDKRVLFASNGDFDEKISPLRLSLDTYSQIVPEGSICTIVSEGGKWYGKSAFTSAIKHAITNNYKYIIYIDADCFICSFDNLYLLFKEFVDENLDVFSGMPDGGVISHRNGNGYSINPFLSFFNVDKIKEMIGSSDLKTFFNQVSSINVSERSKNSRSLVIEKYSEWRNKVGFVTRHGNMISGSNFPNHTFYTPNQRIYTSKDSNFSAEPYYDIFLRAHDGKNSIKYMFAKDYIGECDDSGITTAVLVEPNFETDDSIVCLHTWFSRCFNMSEKRSSMETETTNRILSVYKWCKEKNNTRKD